MDFLKLIESTGYITVSKELARNIGLDETLILTELISKYNYWKENNKLKDGYFYVTIKDLKKETTLTKYRQTKAINNLKELNLIKTKKQGLPAKRYFTILKENIIEQFYDLNRNNDKNLHNTQQNTKVENQRFKSDKDKQNSTSKDENQQNNPSNSYHDLEVKNSKTSKGKNGKLNGKNSTQLRINNKNNNKKEEEESELSTNKISEKTQKLFYQVYDRNMKNYEAKLILNYNFSDELLQKALKLTGTYGGKTLAYLLNILDQWNKKEINSLEEAEKQIKLYKNPAEEDLEDYYKKGYR